MKINYHIHTTFSDGSSKMLDYCEIAIRKGFNEIAFTDHLTIFPDGSAEPYSLNELKLGDYVKEVEKASEKYEGRLNVRLGLEVDYIPGNEEILRKLLNSHEFDLIIGSVHFVDGICIDSSKQRKIVDEAVKRQGFDVFYSKYLNLVGRAVETGFFDIIGHIDLVKIWGFNPTNGFDDERKILELIRRKKLCLEVSSRGLRQPINSAYPSPRILKEAYELNIPITVGTDAHFAEEIDYAYDFLMKYIKTVGYEQVTVFSKRKPFEKNIE